MGRKKSSKNTIPLSEVQKLGSDQVKEWADELARLPEIIEKKDVAAAWSIFSFAQESARSGVLRLVAPNLKGLSEVIRGDVRDVITAWGSLLEETGQAVAQIRCTADHNIANVDWILMAIGYARKGKIEEAKEALRRGKFQQLQANTLESLLKSYQEFLARLEQVQVKLRSAIKKAKIKRLIFLGVAGVSAGVLCLSLAAAVLCTAGLVASPALAGLPALVVPAVAAIGLVGAGVGVAATSAAISAGAFGSQVCKELERNAKNTEAALEQLKSKDFPEITADIDKITSRVPIANRVRDHDDLLSPDEAGINWEVTLKRLKDRRGSLRKALLKCEEDLKLVSDETKALYEKTIKLRYEYHSTLRRMEQDLNKLLAKYDQKKKDKKLKDKIQNECDLDGSTSAGLLRGSGAPKQEDTNVSQSSST